MMYLVFVLENKSFFPSVLILFISNLFQEACDV